MWFSSWNYSWFISFYQNAYKINFPLWFIQWWNNFGLTDDILPSPHQESYFYLSRTIQKNSFHNSMRFYLYFQIPQNFCWSFCTTSYPQYKMITKQWWNKYNFQHATIKNMKVWFVENNYLQDLDQRKNTEFLNEKNLNFLQLQHRPQLMQIFKGYQPWQ